MKKGRIEIRTELCKACELCIEVCRHNGLRRSKTLNRIGYVPMEPNPDGNCNGCALCAIRCPEAAIEVWRDE
ncbi:MAG: 4Fe-4S binding protein [Candidatus Alcyoniella australis]|nr:4Fe-4S binding protein [Candidatus Alcyoniella australis]